MTVEVTFDNAGRTGRSGTIQRYTIRSRGIYRIEVGGARGGTHTANYGDYPGTFPYLLWYLLR